MEATSLQLFTLNQRTLTQWFNRRENTLELDVLTQGFAHEDRIAVAGSQLPAPREKLEEAPYTSGPLHEFVLPQNRAGQAPKLRPGQRPASASAVRPIAPAALPAPAPLHTLTLLNPGTMVLAPGASEPSAPLVLGPAPASVPTRAPLPARARVLAPASVPAPAPLPTCAPVQSPAPALAPAPVAGPASLPAPVSVPVPVSRFTQRNRRRRAEEEASGTNKRKYVREVAFNKCSKCGEPKSKDFGHSRFGSATFCPSFSGGKSLEQWLAEQRQ
ncbi:BCL-6 corepressor-like protein 1 [Thalassophryne amazonica]|uniref:BCL-6 corepressor-like protein 1 n=1 Tax=Thalassophryne amazonica TaxID=390379 RepID=UPI0014718EBF|nr:BCL-6 corepressor-like protein 1 [Thalassophryne amazonica]